MVQVDNRCRLADLEEGRIGKLRVHRSGRVSLALGDTMFEVSGNLTIHISEYIFRLYLIFFFSREIQDSHSCP